MPDCVRRWNSIQPELRMSESLKEFSNKICNKVKTHLMHYGISRKLNIIHSQFGLGCRDLNEDFKGLHVMMMQHVLVQIM